MPGYHYTALTNDGDSVDGTLVADSPRLARQALRERGLSPISVDELAAVTRRRFSYDRRLSSRQMALATRQLAGLLSSGVPLARALGSVADQAESATARKLFAALRADVSEGRSLAESISAQGERFPSAYAPLAEAGERTGSLGHVFMKLADALEASAETRRKVTLALAYPAVLTVVAGLAVIGLTVEVLPRIVEVFEDTHQELPILTKGMIVLSRFLSDWGGLISLALIGIAITAWRLLQDETRRETFHERLLTMPVLGPLLLSIETARFTSALSILLAGGAPLLFSLTSAAKNVRLIPLKRALATTITEVTHGRRLSEGLNVTGRFPLLLVSYVANGESDGSLGQSLEWAAEQMNRDLAYRIESFTTLFEPTLILTMGGLVLLIVLAALLPIFDMNMMVR